MSFLVTEWVPQRWMYSQRGEQKYDKIINSKRADDQQSVSEMKLKISELIHDRKLPGLSTQYDRPVQGYAGHVPAVPTKEDLTSSVPQSLHAEHFRRMQTNLYRSPSQGHRAPMSSQVRVLYPYNPYNSVNSFRRSRYGDNY